MIDSPGLIETNHQLELMLMSGQARNTDDIGNIIIKTTPSGAPLHIFDVATVRNSVMPVYTVVTANGKPAVLLNVYRQPVPTERGARTMTVDSKNHRVYLLAAEFGPAPQAAPGTRTRPRILPDTFHVLVVGRQ